MFPISVFIKLSNKPFHFSESRARRTTLTLEYNMHCTYSLACSLNVDPDSIVVNILQKDMFPQDVDTEIRRGCYAICLQLARFVVQYV